jgi:iron-sulfur cluster repair protein YtfE (RIC family)
MDPFAFPAERIGRACDEHGVSWDAFLAEMRKASDPPVPKPRAVPLPVLLERLTGDHRKFIRSYLPAIGEAFSPRGNGVVGETLQPLFRDWPAFMTGLKEHIATEEEFLFPKILRYDYCLRHGKADPEFSNGSVKVFVAIHLLKNEERGAGALRRFLEEPLPASSADGGDGDAPLMRLLASFRKELLEHARVEREELFPMAASLENELYDRTISGRVGPRTDSVSARK